MELAAVSGSAEQEAWLAIHNAAVPARQWSPAWLRSMLAHDHDQVLAREATSPIGAALAIAQDDGVLAWISVAPDRRGRGVGSALWTHMRAWAHPRAIEVRVEAEDGRSVAFARARGLAVVREEPRLVNDLAQAPVFDATGVRVVALRDAPELVEGIDQVLEPRGAAWREQLLQAERAGNQRTSVALRAGAVAGYAVLLLAEARPGVASHVGTFVRPELKRLGVAGALKAEQVAWARAAGYERLEASAEASNEAKMRLYARLGYREAPGWTVCRT